VDEEEIILWIHVAEEVPGDGRGSSQGFLLNDVPQTFVDDHEDIGD
jgi:hypothetical protein